MSEDRTDRPSLKEFDADTDRKGQDSGGPSSQTQGRLKRDPAGEAQTARIASGMPGEDATDATEAETPEQTLRRIGDAGSASEQDRAGEAIERATAALWSEEGSDRGR